MSLMGVKKIDRGVGGRGGKLTPALFWIFF